MSGPTVTVAVDAMGGDNAPGAVLDGLAMALDRDPHLRVLLAGDEDTVSPAASERVEPLVTTEVIGAHDEPVAAVRSKSDSSMVAVCRAVREGRADACVSLGNTGALMAAGTLVIGRLPGITRPAIATIMPTTAGRLVLLDAGANADCRPEHLVQFAHMGAAYARVVLGIESPKVGLLSIGEEDTKGSQLVLETRPLMREQVPGFAGNVEARDIPFGTVDVVVTDGFTGNVVLKLMEGMAEALFGRMRDAITARPADRLAAAVLKPRFAELRAELDPEKIGGAPLLGLAASCIKGHGSSRASAVDAALGVAARAVRGGLVHEIETTAGGQGSAPGG